MIEGGKKTKIKRDNTQIQKYFLFSFFQRKTNKTQKNQNWVKKPLNSLTRRGGGGLCKQRINMSAGEHSDFLGVSQQPNINSILEDDRSVRDYGIVTMKGNPEEN